jgi:hypothetical protein
MCHERIGRLCGYWHIAAFPSWGPSISYVERGGVPRSLLLVHMIYWRNLDSVEKSIQFCPELDQPVVCTWKGRIYSFHVLAHFPCQVFYRWPVGIVKCQGLLISIWVAACMTWVLLDRCPCGIIEVPRILANSASTDPRHSQANTYRSARQTSRKPSTYQEHRRDKADRDMPRSERGRRLLHLTMNLHSLHLFKGIKVSHLIDTAITMVIPPVTTYDSWSKQVSRRSQLRLHFYFQKELEPSGSRRRKRSMASTLL